MRIARITIRNFLGVQELEFEPGAFTVVTGANGAGKSSVLEAIGSVFAGGHDATLIHNGAESGEVVLLLDDGTEIRRSITAKGSYLSARDPERGALKSPATYVSRLVDALAFNPVEFLTARADRQVEYLLESLPLSVSQKAVDEALGGAVKVDDLPEGHALEVLERLRKEVFDERTGVNRSAKDKRATIGQLSESLPEGEKLGPDLAERIEALEVEDTALGQRHVEESASIDRQAAERERQVRAEAERQLEELRQEYQRKVDAVKADRDRTVKSIEAEATERRAALEVEVVPRQQELRAEKRALEERAKHAAQHARTREVVSTLTTEADALEARSAALTRALEGLDALKGKLVSTLPIKGLEIRDGELFVDGIPFRRVNTARRVQVALNLAAARAKRSSLPLVRVDGLELLDAKTFEAFAAKASLTGLQFVVARVGEGALSVSTTPAAEVAS